MAKLPGQGLDGNEAEERQSFIDPGTYNVEIINSNGKENEKSGVYRIGLQLQVLDGPKAKSTFWLSFNYLHPGSAQAQDISQNQLRLIAKACGVGLFEDTESLHNKPFSVSVKTSESNGYTNNDMTSAREYATPGGSGAKGATASSSKTSSSAPAKAADKGGGKPWEKKKGA
jgi:hypothetical protein